VLADLMEHAWLLFSGKSWIDTRVNEAFRRAGAAPPQSIVRACSVHFCIAVLGTNRFLARLPDRSCASMLHGSASRSCQ
jgi:hypothetical protein